MWAKGHQLGKPEFPFHFSVTMYGIYTFVHNAHTIIESRHPIRPNTKPMVGGDS